MNVHHVILRTGPLARGGAVGASRRWWRVCDIMEARRGAAWRRVTGAGREDRQDRCRHVGALPRESVCERGRRVRRARGVGTAAARHF